MTARDVTPRYDAVVFDMDGVLADSEPVYYAAMNAVLATLGQQITPELQRQVMGHGVEESWAAVAAALKLEGPLNELIGLYDSELCRQLAEIKEPLPGVHETIAALRQRGMPVALASSSWPGWIDALLGGIGLREQFDAIVSATMVEHPKPAPDIYLLAAERLGVAPERCIAVEDTPTGLASARAAGMHTVQVRSASTAFEPQPDAAVVLDSLEQFDLGWLATSYK
jgi:HAD superfamily hydrolase (TIGR01509 family)